ncbi:MAG: DNA-binding protein [Mesorhizobium sp.]|nr:DNA-binding protein [Mesorhizobium sp. M8A.F.Ca.ET.023.01.1.1]RWC78344.1 MAG: DNA-binding protein [Mesorhizobium sp.]
MNANSEHAQSGKEYPESAFVAPEEAAAMIGIGRSMLFELLKAGTIKSSRLRSRRLIAREEVQRFIDQLKAEAA